MAKKKVVGLRGSLGEVIREARHEKGMSQAAIERTSGVPKARLSRYENGHVLPSLETLDKIARGMDTRGSDLLKVAEG